MSDVYVFVSGGISRELVFSKSDQLTISLGLDDWWILGALKDSSSHLDPFFYQPQQSCGQGNIFTPVCHSVHRGAVCLSACWDTTPWSRHPLPRADTPQSRHPPRADSPLEQTPPGDQTPPSPGAHSGIWSMSGRYASYWNAFLFYFT